MGDAEFEGGGSVKWKVRHSKGEDGNPGGNGKDQDPESAEATFLVYADDVFKFALPAKDHHKVKVFWGPEALAPAALTSTLKKKGGRTTKTATKGARPKP
jgi:hypothetical protein